MRVYNQKIEAFEEIPVARERKPHRLNLGYIAELKNRRTGIGHVTIYYSKEAQLDESCGKYAIVCQEHNNMVYASSLPSARGIMKAVDFCEQCL